jgi:hypothetical protein
MKNDGLFLIPVNLRYYWSLDLNPIPNEFDEPINRCALVDSETKKEIDCIAFDSHWLLPIFQMKDGQGLKLFAQQLKEVTERHKLVIVPRELMPKDKRIKETKKVTKRVVK